MKPVLRLFIFVIIWLLSGCAYSPVASVAQDSKAKDFNTSPHKASLYIYRNETLYYAVPMTVSVNGKVLGTTAGHKYFRLSLRPGKYTIESSAENLAKLTLTVEAGKNYFIWQEAKIGLLTGRSLLHQVDEETGRMGVNESKLIAAKVSDDELLPLDARTAPIDTAFPSQIPPTPSMAPVMAVSPPTAAPRQEHATQRFEERTIPRGSGKRLALVVGGDNYRHVSTLRNARADARAVSVALKKAGFDVTVEYDLGDKALKEAMRNFKARISGGDEAVFYFSGHGVQFGSANYLLPVDITGESQEQIQDDALSLQRVLDDMQEQKARFSLVIVDACRNNPFRNQGRALGGRGLIPVNPATGQMVLYSAGAGQQALDRLDDGDRDPNGVFTRVLLKEMNRPGVSVDRVLRNVRDQVVKMTRHVNHEQVPALYDQSIGEFYFLPATGN